MAPFIRWSIIALFAVIGLTDTVRAAKPFRSPAVRFQPVKPIPNMTTTRAFFNPLARRFSLYVPPNINPHPGSNDQFGLLVQFGAERRVVPAVPFRPAVIVTGTSGGGMMGGGYGSSSPMAYSMPYPVPQPSTPSVPTQPTPAPETNPLDTLGLPHQAGHLLWPLGLRILPPALQTQPLLQQLDAQLLQLATQVVNNAVDVDLTRQTLANIKSLRRFLHEGESRMAQATAVEAKQFLSALETTIERFAQ